MFRISQEKVLKNNKTLYDQKYSLNKNDLKNFKENINNFVNKNLRV